MELFLNGEHQDPHLAGRSLVAKAGALIEQGDTESAIQALRKANGLIDPVREPHVETSRNAPESSLQAMPDPIMAARPGATCRLR